MAKGTLDLDKMTDADRRTGLGHGTGALGPSDRSDSGSDMTGLTDFDSDTDSNGTGERASVNMKDSGLARDLDADRIDEGFVAEDASEQDFDEDSGLPEGRQKPKPEVEV